MPVNYSNHSLNQVDNYQCEKVSVGRKCERNIKLRITEVPADNLRCLLAKLVHTPQISRVRTPYKKGHCITLASSREKDWKSHIIEKETSFVLLFNFYKIHKILPWFILLMLFEQRNSAFNVKRCSGCGNVPLRMIIMTYYRTFFLLY